MRVQRCRGPYCTRGFFHRRAGCSRLQKVQLNFRLHRSLLSTRAVQRAIIIASIHFHPFFHVEYYVCYVSSLNKWPWGNIRGTIITQPTHTTPYSINYIGIIPYWTRDSKSILDRELKYTCMYLQRHLVCSKLYIL